MKYIAFPIDEINTALEVCLGEVDRYIDMEKGKCINPVAVSIMKAKWQGKAESLGEMIKFGTECNEIISNIMNLNELKYKAASFSDRTFGVHNPITGPLHHLHEEIDEILHCIVNNEDPLDEFADCFLMLTDAFRKHYGNDVDMQKLIDASSDKLDVCETRKWGKPDKHGVFKHIKE
jgi:hypothetical protein